MGLTLGHEAHRDGISGQDNYLETRSAVTGHTEMAIRMLRDGQELSMNTNLQNDIGAYMMGQDVFNAYADGSYDSSADYWKLMEDGNIVFDGSKDLYDSNGNMIRRTSSSGLQSSLAELLHISMTQAEALMFAAGMKEDGQGNWGTGSNGIIAGTNQTAIEFNMGKAIQLGQNYNVAGVDYDAQYNQYLSKDNTLNIYNQLVSAGKMDMAYNGSTLEPISYSQYKANNFIQGLGMNPIQYNTVVLGKALNADGTWSGALDSVNISAFFQTMGNATAGGIHVGVDMAVSKGTPIRGLLYGDNTSVSQSGFGTLNSVQTKTALNYSFKGQSITDNIFTTYSHLSQRNVFKDDSVSGQNEVLGLTGDTGSTGAYHLHMELSGNWNTTGSQSMSGSPYLNLLAMQNSQTGSLSYIDNNSTMMRTNDYLIRYMNSTSQKTFYDPLSTFLVRPGSTQTTYNWNNYAYIYSTSITASQMQSIQKSITNGMNQYNFWKYGF